MSDVYQSLTHSKWDCKYYVVFVPEKAKEGHLRPIPAAIGRDFPCAGAAERVPDSGRTPHAGPCAHVHRDSSQAPGGVGDWVSEGEECDRHCSLGGARNATLAVSISGPAVMPYPPSGSSWSKSENTSASKKKRMEQRGNFETNSEARIARRLNRWPNRL